MYVDASAIVAIIVAEQGYGRLLESLDAAEGVRITAPIAVFEAAAGIARIRDCPLADARALVQDFLREANVEIVPISERHGELAVDALARFGKGRHPAALNLGDCFGYAVAKAAGAPILFTGNDFSRTDLASASVARP